jgi:hypothetical protein
MFAAVLCLITLAATNPPDKAGLILVSENLGEKAYTASGVWNFRPSLAFDGDSESGESYWNSGDHPVQWIEVDLQQTYRLAQIKLVAAQYPNGATLHEVWVSDKPIQGDLTGARRLCHYEGMTLDRDILTFPVTEDRTARYVQVRTIASPSWVAWMEIQVWATPDM